MKIIPITGVLAVSLCSSVFAVSGGVDPVPVADCSPMPCTIRIKAEAWDGPVFTAPLPFTSDTPERELVPFESTRFEVGVPSRWWRIGTAEDGVEISISEPISVFGQDVLIVQQITGFEVIQQKHLVFHLAHSGFRKIAEFEDGIGLVHASNLKLTEEGFQFHYLVVNFATDKGYEIDEQEATISTYNWRERDGQISAERVSQMTKMVPY